MFRSLVFSCCCIVVHFQSKGWCSEVWCSVVVLLYTFSRGAGVQKFGVQLLLYCCTLSVEGLVFRSLVFSCCIVVHFQSRGWCSEVWCSVVVVLLYTFSRGAGVQKFGVQLLYCCTLSVKGLVFRSLVFSCCIVAHFQSWDWCSEVWCSVVVLLHPFSHGTGVQKFDVQWLCCSTLSVKGLVFTSLVFSGCVVAHFKLRSWCSKPPASISKLWQFHSPHQCPSPSADMVLEQLAPHIGMHYHSPSVTHLH